MTLQFKKAEFLLSVHKLSQLPAADCIEIAFAGRSNVGKSSLLNTLLERKNFVKVSARPGKTQGLNFFRVDNDLLLVDLPGYGYAKVSKSQQMGWRKLITQYLEDRSSLCCVVVIVDLRHPAKPMDIQLLDWLRSKQIPFLPVYTKADKLSGNERNKNGALLDAGLGVDREKRILFSAKTGMGVEQLRQAILQYTSPHFS